MEINTLRRLSLLIFFSLFCMISFAGVIKGKITDSETSEPLIGATVQIESYGKKISTFVNLDGSYIFKNIEPGKYEMNVFFAGYKQGKKNVVTVSSVSDQVVINISLTSEIYELENIIVKSDNTRESDNAVRRLEKNADIVKNVLSQKSIELSPDVTVANSLQRISGVSVQRSSSGEGRYAIIRGMEQRYNSTLINGIKIPSPDDKFRYVPLDIFPSDILERIEVIKALMPNMEGDAIGGTMNLVMKSAPNKRSFNAFFSEGQNLLFKDRPFSAFDNKIINRKDPSQINGNSYIALDKDFPRNNLDIIKNANPVNLQTGFTYGDRFFRKKMGFILALSYQNNFRGSDNIFNQQDAQPTYRRNLTVNGVTGLNFDNNSKFGDAYIRQYSTLNKRFAVNNKYDYVINQNNKLSLFNLFVRLDELQVRNTVDTNVSTNPGQITYNTRTRWQIQTIYNSTLQGEHVLSERLKLNWNAVYSIANQDIPDIASFNTTNIAVNGILINTKDELKGMTRIWTNNTDKDYSGYLNLIYNTQIGNKKLELSTGSLFRHKDRDNYYNSYSLSASGTLQPYTNILDARYNFNPAGAGGANLNTPNTYSLTEEITAGYTQFKFQANSKLQLIGGVRAEYTNQNYNTAAPETYNLRYGRIYYTDLLPSLHIKYTLSPKQNLRASYFGSLVRPGYYEITPYYLDGTEDLYPVQGNPTLKHTTADNFDIRYEWFPNGADQFLAGVFYKQIHNPIETAFYNKLITGGNSGTSTAILTPQNFGDVVNYGIEFVYTKFIGNFGVNANYTYTHSAITTPKNYFFYDVSLNPARGNTKVIEQTRPLQGQSNHIGNLSLIYKNPKTGIDIQLAYVYTGEKIALVSSYFELDTWQSPFEQLDFSFEKKLIKKLSFYGKINNLTDSKTRYFIKQPYILGNTLNKIPGQDNPENQIFVQRDIYRISYQIGLRLKL